MKLIYDSSNADKLKRYRSPIYVNFITSKNLDFIKNALKDNIQINSTSITCTSSIKQTHVDWLYIFPYNVDRNKTLAWIDEFNKLYDNLNITILPEYSYLKLNTNNHQYSSYRRFSHIDRKTGEFIINNDEFTINNELAYAEKEFKNIFTITDSVNDIIKTINTLDNDSLHKAVGYVYGILKVHNITKMKELLLNNADIIHDMVRPDKNNMDRILVHVNYSNRKSSIQSYLVHQLIRLLMVPEQECLINQYYRIKELVPDIFFWNAMTLAIMGMNYYYYWFFTEHRCHKLFKDAYSYLKFEKDYKGYSSNEFFRMFHIPTSSKYSDLYKEENITELIKQLPVIIFEEPTNKNKNNNFKLELTVIDKTKFKNIRIAPHYFPEKEDNNYYYIKGDDLVVRKYGKKNFTVKKIKQ